MGVSTPQKMYKAKFLLVLKYLITKNEVLNITTTPLDLNFIIITLYRYLTSGYGTGHQEIFRKIFGSDILSYFTFSNYFSWLK